ncbi:MAG: fibronectin type III domain-containing protein [Eubacterium sp.]|nr:fibronectin type III domain-containing protein [Eubacterium sp.]
MLFVLSSGYCAYAQSSSNDVYGITLGSMTGQPTPAYEAIPVPESATVHQAEVTLRVSDITPNSAVISWSSEVTYITYTLLKFNVFTNTYQEVLSTTETTVQLTDLAEDTDYQFALISNNTSLLGETEFTTGVEKAAITVDKVSSSAVELSLQHSVNTSSLVLYRSTDGENYTELATLDGDSYTDTDVAEATTYYYQAKCVVTRGDKTSESQLSAPVQATTMKSFGLPAVSGATKTYAYYTAVTARSSPQYKLLRSDACYTDPETGIRMVDGRYCVALGSYYGTKIGTKYRITLEGGKELEVILCDQKSDRHTDANHQYAVNNQDILEFYIEKSKLPRGIRGNYGTLPQFSGAVVAIEQYVED